MIYGNNIISEIAYGFTKTNQIEKLVISCNENMILTFELFVNGAKKEGFSIPFSYIPKLESLIEKLENNKHE